MNITFLNKEAKSIYLPLLYDILYANLNGVVTNLLTKENFISAVSDGLAFENRQILLLYNKDKLAGFMQYFVSKDNTTFRIEELQIKREYQKSNLLFLLIRFILNSLPQELEYVEAFSHVENEKSIHIQKHLGLNQIDIDNGIIHMRGDHKIIRKKYINK